MNNRGKPQSAAEKNAQSYFKKAEQDEQFFKAYTWDGDKLNLEFTVDFKAKKLGSAHQMRFGAYGLYGLKRPYEAKNLVASDE